jgi:isoquinoline 1-oxidoreductase alpha subunit
MRLEINRKMVEVEAPEDMPLLWVLRDLLGLTGTKYGCGIAQCGACTVHVDGKAKRSCITKAGTLAGKSITTIEGLGTAGLHRVQQAWVDEDVVQCGYCQPGQIMTAAALLGDNSHPSADEIDAAMRGNLCRCGTYQRIRGAVQRAAELGGGGKS